MGCPSLTPPTLLQFTPEKIKRVPHPLDRRTRRHFLALRRALFQMRRRLLIHRHSLAQQMPRLPILLKIRFPGIRAERHISPSRQLFLRNDVPRVFRNDVRRQEIKCPARIVRIVLPHGTHIPSPVLHRGGLHLHARKVSRLAHHEIETVGISPRPAHRQSMFHRPHHEHRLAPLPPWLRLLDNPRLPPLHATPPLFYIVIPTNSSPVIPTNSSPVIPTKRNDWRTPIVPRVEGPCVSRQAPSLH